MDIISIYAKHERRLDDRCGTLAGLAFSMRPYSSQCSLSSDQAYPSLRDQSMPSS